MLACLRDDLVRATWGQSKWGHCRLLTFLTFARVTRNLWNQHMAARICDHEASSHRKDIERISNKAAEPWLAGANDRCGTNDAYRTVRTVCIYIGECRKMHG